MKNEQVYQLLYEALETEIGGVLVYKTAIRCALNDELKEEWEKYLDQTENHERIIRELLGKFELDPDMETPGRKIVRHIGESLVKAMELALTTATRLTTTFDTCQLHSLIALQQLRALTNYVIFTKYE